VSNSDAHSLPNIAREANVFEIDKQRLSYDEICRVIKDKNPAEFLYTIEFYPEEGMYHYDGHRDCGVSFAPNETKKHKNICPVCKKPLTVGVLNRVEELADLQRGPDYIDKARVAYKKLIELDKIIAESLQLKSRKAKRVQEEYVNLIKVFGNELNILLKVNYDDLAQVALAQIVEGIKRVREGKLYIQPGFDGQYGQIKIFSDQDRVNGQKSLF
jgi:PHP family Zn ribbon phosphoesterase